MYPRRTPLALSHIRPLPPHIKFILLCCNGANPFESIARAVKCTHNELHACLWYLISHGLLYPPQERVAS
jgi:hypothetical protein